MSFRIISASLLALSTLALGETLIMQPGPEGKDASVFGRSDAVGKNYGDATTFQASTWTWNADQLGTGSFRSLLSFDLGALPAGAIVKSAKLFLYGDTQNYTSGHSSLSASNAAQLLRVKQAWAESTVTWNNQPETDTAGRVSLAQSTAAKQNYVLDVTAMVREMAADSAKNHGFLLRTLAETPYNGMMFASSDHKDSTMHPRLQVEYDPPRNPNGTVFAVRPGAEGKDATLFSRSDAVGKNYGDATTFQAGNWTWNADALGVGGYRSLIQFNLKEIPAAATVKSAKLYLYCDTLNFTKGHSSLSASNAAYLMRVNETWAESTVTWNTQPAVDTGTRITLAKSKGLVQDYAVDVSAMVAAMVADASKNHGFLLRSITESPYNSLMFASGDHKDSALHPMLEVEYEYVSTRLDRGLAAARAHSGDLRIRFSAGMLILSREAAGQMVDLSGQVVSRFGKTGSVDVGALKSGAYVLRTEGQSLKVFVP